MALSTTLPSLFAIFETGMKRAQTKHVAEAVLRELPSVIGACVREDVMGRPREVHLLVRGVSSARDLAHDVRSLLEERLDMEIDQRIISIAQLSEAGPFDIGEHGGPAEAPSAAAPPADASAEGPQGTGAAPAAAEPAPAEPATAEHQPAEHQPDRPIAAPAAPMPGARPRARAPEQAAPAGRGAAAATLAGGAAEQGAGRLVYDGLETSARDARVSVRARLWWRDQEYVGDGTEVDAGHGRARAAAAAVVRAATAACEGRTRFELEAASVSRALERDYVLVSVLAVAQWLGRRPVPLVGAHPVEGDVTTAAALAVLKATNRVIERSLG